ncbi:hypothetical protein ACH5RR_007115, partial [Cinchona calisaya]
EIDKRKWEMAGKGKTSFWRRKNDVGKAADIGVEESSCMKRWKRMVGLREGKRCLRVGKARMGNSKDEGRVGGRNKGRGS